MTASPVRHAPRKSPEQGGAAIDDLLRRHQVIVCAGSGGVGKTTVAAALGVRAAQLGINTLVLTIDPARRLATALGIDLKDDQEQRVMGRDCPGELHVAVVDSRKTFDQFIARHAPNPESAARIMNNRLYRQLSTTLSGSQEFTSLERLYQSVECGRHQLVILDTPPTKHAMDFLQAPAKIQSLFQESIAGWLGDSASGGKRGLIAGLLARGTRPVMKSLEVLTGGQFIEELADFFSAMRSVQRSVRERSIAAQKLLSSAHTRFLVVTSFDAAKLEEARELQVALRSMGFTLEAVIINRAFPVWLPDRLDGESAPPGFQDAFEKVLNFFDEFKEFHSVRYNLYERFANEVGRGVRIFRIPEYDQDIHGPEDLEMLVKRLVNDPESGGA